jgi:hypothetical protein
MTHRRGETSRQEGEGGENDGGARQDSTGGGVAGGWCVLPRAGSRLLGLLKRSDSAAYWEGRVEERFGRVGLSAGARGRLAPDCAGQAGERHLP